MIESPDTNKGTQKYIDINLGGFAVKYKTEICRNWELYGHCEFNDTVKILILFNYTI
jgi:hypothetical protein